MALKTTRGRLMPTPPFDFDKALRFLETLIPMRGEQTTAGGALIKAIALGGKTVVFRVNSTGTVDTPRLEYTLYARSALTEAEQAEAAARISAFLSLNDDLRLFYAIGGSDAHFEPLRDQLHGYHQVRFPTPFEAACWAILAQRTSMVVAHKHKQNLTELFSSGLRVEGREYLPFPEANVLAQAGEDAIRAAVRDLRKASYISAAARAFDGMSETWLQSAPLDAVRAWLREIRGIGEWSAGLVLLRGLGRMETVPLNDERILAAARQVYGDVSTTELREIADSYGPCQGYWGHYLRAAEAIDSSSAVGDS
jgi:DNA-3-methyladenine glycosylase II